MDFFKKEMNLNLNKLIGFIMIYANYANQTSCEVNTGGGLIHLKRLR